jgi:hypothetical protein
MYSKVKLFLRNFVKKILIWAIGCALKYKFLKKIGAYISNSTGIYNRLHNIYIRNQLPIINIDNSPNIQVVVAQDEKLSIYAKDIYERLIR